MKLRKSRPKKSSRFLTRVIRIWICRTYALYYPCHAGICQILSLSSTHGMILPSNILCRSLNLKSVQSLTLRPLRYLTRPLRHNTRRSHRPVSEAYFEELAQPLELVLSHNQLERIPEEIYNLTNLEFLGVRANDITEILPSISRLSQMINLSVGSNKLRWLPAELIGLMSTNLNRVTTHGNPFVHPILSAGADGKERDFIFPSWSETPLCRFRSETAYLNIDGTCVPGWAPAPS